MLSNSLRLFTAGFTMGWGPCLIYTAPLILPYIGAMKRSWQDGLKIALIFSAGRLLALTILGGVAAFAFNFINQFFPPQKSGWLYLIVAFFMIAMGTFIILGKGFRMNIGKTIINKENTSVFLVGFLMGIAPCLPYVAILTYIACVAEGSPFIGAFYASLFALGTAISLIVLGPFMGIITEKLFKTEKAIKAFHLICAIVLILFGFELTYYVLNLII